jgi:integrase
MTAAACKIALTDRSLQAMKPAADGRRTVVWDALLPGLAVRVSDKGRRSFYAVKRRAGRQQPSWVLLGSYPVTTLAEARAKAREALGALMAGDDPATLAEPTRRAKEEDERRLAAGTFAAVAERFVKQHLPRLRSARAGEALIRRELIPTLGSKPIGEIRRRDVIALLEAIVARGAPEPGRARPRSGGEYAARHALASLRKIYNWALSRDIEGIEANPCGRVKAADLLGSSKARDRVLSDTELRLVWRAAEATGYPFGDLVRALLMTGQRLREIGEARWSEIGGRTLMIPAERMKSKVAHAVPMTDRTRALFGELPRFAGGEYLFSTTAGRRPISGYSKMKARFDCSIADLVEQDRAQIVAAGGSEAERVRAIERWTLHDLRRTARTGLAAAGVSVFVAELVIGHRQSGVHGVYDMHTYDAEKRQALEKWEARLMRIVAPDGPNVVPLRPEAAA